MNMTFSQRFLSITVATFISNGLLNNAVYASGFQLIENNASGQGNAYAGAAALAEDASTVWFNPAGMTKLKNKQIVVAGHIIVPDSSFTNEGSTDGFGNLLSGDNDDGGSTALVGNFYWVTDLGKKTKFGLGITTPFGLTTEYNDTWIGRYHAVETSMTTININPSIARAVTDKLSVGAGFSLLLADVTLTSAIDFGSLLGAPGQADGFAELHGDNLKLNEIAWGFNFGFMYDFNKDTTLGFAYRSGYDITAKGDAKFSVPTAAAPILSSGAFQPTTLRAKVSLPQNMSFSIKHDMNEDIILLADISWTGWSSFEELRIQYDSATQPDSLTTENWDNTLRYSIGADFKYSNKLTLRTGIAYDETPIPNEEFRTPRIPGSNRTWVSFGFTYAIDPSLIVDVGYSHLFIEDAKIDHSLESSLEPLNATLKGEYEASVDILSAQLRWNYDL